MPSNDGIDTFLYTFIIKYMQLGEEVLNKVNNSQILDLIIAYRSR